MPSFFKSTLSLAFIISVISVIVMIFLKVEVDDKLLSIVSAIVAAYLASRTPNSKPEDTLNDNPPQ